MRATFIPIVRAEKLDEFLSKWQTWFVLEDTVRDEKTPGKLKGKGSSSSEFYSKNTY